MLGRGALVLATLVVLSALMTSCGKSNDQTLDAELDRAASLFDALGADVVERARVTESKGVRYVTATATLAGDQKAVVADLTDALGDAGWVIVSERPLDVGQSPATEADEIIARDDGVVVRLTVFDRIGARPAAEGTRWVQLSLSPVGNDALSWTML